MEITAKMVKELREATNAGMMDCKKALKETGGDMDAAADYLRKKGIASAAKKEGRATSQGIVGSYIHMGGKVGVLVEVACETDFVARTDDFQNFVHDIAMHVAAADPVAVTREEVDPSVIEKEKEIYAARMREEGKPDNIIDKIVEGKVDKYYSEIVLLEQKYVKDPDMTVEDYLKSIIGKLGENMQIKRFTRYQIGG
jgi:elongation factor Ts